MASYYISSYDYESVTIRVTGLTKGDTVRYFVRLASSSSATVDKTYTATGTTLTKTFSGLSPDTDYVVNVQINGPGSWLGADSFTTDSEPLPEPYFVISTYTSTTVWVNVYDLQYGDTVRVLVRLASDTSDSTYDNKVTVYKSSYTLEVGGLKPNTNYIVNVQINGPGSWLGGQSFTTEGLSRPWNWAFYSTITKGGAIGLTALEWTHFCERINEFRLYAGLSEYSFTPVYKGTPISASICNEARTAISSIPGCGTLPSRAYSSNRITASFFNQLVEALNSIP